MSSATCVHLVLGGRGGRKVEITCEQLEGVFYSLARKRIKTLDLT